jgi:hypothetical protein
MASSPSETISIKLIDSTTLDGSDKEQRIAIEAIIDDFGIRSAQVIVERIKESTRKDMFDNRFFSLLRFQRHKALKTQ